MGSSGGSEKGAINALIKIIEAKGKGEGGSEGGGEEEEGEEGEEKKVSWRRVKGQVQRWTGMNR
jgi:hypothetical protein